MSEQMSREEMLSVLERIKRIVSLTTMTIFAEDRKEEMCALEMAISLLTQTEDTITISRATADVCESALLLFGISLMKTVEASERKKMPESARIGRERAEEVRKAREEIVSALTKEGGETQG